MITVIEVCAPTYLLALRIKALADLIAGISFLAPLEGAPDELFRAYDRSVFLLNPLNFATEPVIRHLGPMCALINRNASVCRIPFVNSASVARKITNRIVCQCLRTVTIYGPLNVLTLCISVRIHGGDGSEIAACDDGSHDPKLVARVRDSGAAVANSYGARLIECSFENGLPVPTAIRSMVAVLVGC